MEKALGIRVVRHITKKPAGDAVDLEKHFRYCCFCGPSIIKQQAGSLQPVRFTAVMLSHSLHTDASQSLQAQQNMYCSTQLSPTSLVFHDCGHCLIGSALSKPQADRLQLIKSALWLT